MKRALLFVGLAVVVTALIVTVAMRRSPTETTNTTNSTNTSTVAPEAQAPVVRDESPEGKDRAEMQTTAKIVGERLGSYSTDTLTMVVPELATYLTSNGQRDAEGFIALERQRLAQAAGSVSLTTVVQASAITEFRSGVSARVALQTVRTEQVGSSAPTQRQQDLNLLLVKSGGRWRVDDATWQ